MTPKIAACIRIRMGGLIMLFSFGVTAPQYRKHPLDWRWRFCRRRGQIRLILCGIVCLLMPKRWTVTCRGLATSKSPSELICGSLFVDSCSRWANWWLIVSGCRRMGLLRKRKLTCGGKTGFCGPNESFCDFLGTSNCKRGSDNNPSECAGSPDTEVYDECCG